VLQAPLAMWLMLAAAALIAMGTVLMRGLTGFTALSQQGWSAVIGILPLIGLSALFEGHQWDAVRHASGVAWFGVVYSALLASVVGHGLYFWLIQRHPVSKVMPYLLLAPVFAILLGVAFHGDRLGPRLLLGGAMVLGGVLIIGLRAQIKSRMVPEAQEA
jgi:O-acetylserine/cysteine efflux transporter